MTYNKNHYGAYQQASHAASEIRQVIMLYEGAINFIEQAKEAIDEKNYEKRYNLINKAISIVTGLNSCLNFDDENAKDTSEALDQYYQEIDMRLLYVQCDNSKESCDAIIEDLRVMLNAWRDVERETEDKIEIPDKKQDDDSDFESTESGGSDLHISV